LIHTVIPKSFPTAAANPIANEPQKQCDEFGGVQDVAFSTWTVDNSSRTVKIGHRSSQRALLELQSINTPEITPIIRRA
jgi:hypothetical protein